jgi:RNase P/RNase MRP subunit p30
MEIIKIKLSKDLNKLNKDSILESNNPIIIRKALDAKKFLAITSIEDEFSKDYMDSKNSNFNNVLATIASRNNIGYALNIKSIMNSKNKVQLFGKIQQNIKLCRKHKVKVYILNNANKNPKDLEAFSRVLKIRTKIIKC